MIPPEEFAPIIEELNRRPLQKNNYRVVAGAGCSQTFGVVNRRSVPADYSRLCWLRVGLYRLLLEFAAKYVSIPFTSITLNQNYKALAHRDKGNLGDSFLVSFGDFTGGELSILEGPLKGLHDVRHRPLVTDFSKILHNVEDWSGNRFSLVFYTIDPPAFGGLRPPLPPPPSVVLHDGRWMFKRGDEIIRDGLPHPLKGRHVAS